MLTLSLSVFVVVIAAAGLGLCVLFACQEAAERAHAWRRIIALYAAIGLVIGGLLVCAVRNLSEELDRAHASDGGARIAAAIEGVHGWGVHR